MIREYLEKIKLVADAIIISEIRAVSGALYDACKKGNAVYVIGNGGSSATASHFICDMRKATDLQMKVVSLVDNMPVISAIANDYSYEDIFIEQLKGVLKKGDVVVAFSGSGKSENILRAVRYANDIEATTVGITGYDGGDLKVISKIGIHAPVDDMQISEDFHMIFTHILMKCMKEIVW